MTQTMQPGERLVYAYDFTGAVGTAEIAVIVSVTQASAGTGAPLVNGGQTIDGRTVRVEWSGGDDRALYLTTVVIDDTAGQRHEIDGEILIRARGIEAEPIGLDEARAQLRVDGSHEDDLILGLITAAREWVEQYTGRALVRRTFREQPRLLGETVSLYRAPALSITSVEHVDASGATVPIDPAVYALRGSEGWPRLALNPGQRWPMGTWPVITYVAGYAPGEVPRPLAQAMLLLISSWFDGRAVGEIPAAVFTLCQPYRAVLL